MNDPAARFDRQTHGLAALFAAAIVVRFAGSLFSATPLGDEGPYLEAMERVAAGARPYGGTGFFYPPVFAVLGARLLEAVGPTGVLAALRIANVAGGAYLLAVSTHFLAPRLALEPTRRALVGVAVIALSPAVRLAVEWGNLSLAISGLAIAALLAWPRRPWAAALGASLAAAIKPMTAMFLVVLPAERWTRSRRDPEISFDPRPWLAAAALQVAALAIGARWLEDFLAQDAGWPEATRNLALHRVLHLAGLEVGASAIFLVVTGAALLGAIALGRRGPERAAPVLALAIGTSIAATPVVWAHTLLLSLPLQARAVHRAARRRARLVPEASTPWRRFEPAFVVLAVVALHATEGIGGIDTAPTAVLVAATGAVWLALGFVLVYGSLGGSGSLSDAP